jgi:anthranilate phosphoribosyltransferase
MKAILQKLFEHKKLTKTEARDILIRISQGDVNPTQIASFLTVYLMRSITTEELAGFREALLSLCVPITFDREIIDLCGTGGDGKDTFNISTLTALVVAASGYAVAKHGNYGVSSISGSSNVLEAMGYTFTNDNALLQKQITEAGICFLHAPLFHPALKGVGPIRKELGLKTFFNILGPLVNPSRPAYQMAGVSSLSLGRLYESILDKEVKGYAIVHTLDGYDEISLTQKTKIISHHGDKMLTPSDFGMTYKDPKELYGGSTLDSNVALFEKILKGNGNDTQNEVVIANAAIAIQTITQKPLSACVDQAKESLLSGAAHRTFKKILDIK